MMICVEVQRKSVIVTCEVEDGYSPDVFTDLSHRCVETALSVLIARQTVDETPTPEPPDVEAG